MQNKKTLVAVLVVLVVALGVVTYWFVQKRGGLLPSSQPSPVTPPEELPVAPTPEVPSATGTESDQTTTSESTSTPY